jgi:retron-type reverse transcriptase
VARCASALAEEHDLLPTTQMGARPGRSTVTALEMLTEQTQTVWANDASLVASMLSLEISGAFDNVSHEQLIHNIRDARLPQWVAEYIRSFLTNRTTTLMLGTYEDRVRPTTSGIPQGSMLSPILFLFFASTLLPQLNAGTTTAIGFVDDTNILTFSRSTEANCRFLERANEKCMAWARTHGATFAPEKY